jgi:hypothetical protein
MAKQVIEFQEWPFQFVDQEIPLRDWLDLRGLSILRLEGSFRCSLGRPVVPRTAGRVRDDLTDVLGERFPDARFNVVHIERMETRGDLEIYYIACYYAVSNSLMPNTSSDARDESSGKSLDGAY